MELFIIRHGDPNYEHDTITPYGWEEAEALGPRIAALKPDKIFASSCTRSQDTAMPACRILGKEFVVQDWMKESMAYMQRFPLNDTAYGDSAYTVSIKGGASPYEDFAPHRAEEVAQMIRNSDAFLESLGYRREGSLYKELYPNKETVCCFCHGGFGSAWYSHLLGMYPIWNCSQFGIKTTSVTWFKFRNFENSGYCIPLMVYMGDVTHLHDLKSKAEVPDYTPMWKAEGEALREKFISAFVSKRKKSFAEDFKLTDGGIFGQFYEGKLFDHLKNKTPADTKETLTFLKKQEAVYVLWDQHDVQKDDSRMIARRPYAVPIKMKGETLVELLRSEKGENVKNRYLPRGLYMFDETLSWCVERSEDLAFYRSVR